MNVSSKGNVFLNPVPNGLRPRSFYSVDRVALYRAMGFRTRDGLGDPKLPGKNQWGEIVAAWKQREVKVFNDHSAEINLNSADWDYQAITFVNGIDLYNCHPELINHEQFDVLREMLKQRSIKLYGSDSIRTRYIKPIPEFTIERCWIGRLLVKLMPPYTPKDGKTQPKLRTSIQKGHSFQRVLIRCPFCDTWQYFGRLNQHMYPKYGSVERSKICRIGEAEIRECVKLKSSLKGGN